MSSLLDKLRTMFPDVSTNKQLKENKGLKVEWLVDGLLLKGGTSLMVADPKTGKSVLARQIAYSVANGLPFLERKANQGLVFYISVEDHKAWVKRHMTLIGKGNDNAIIWSFSRARLGVSFAESVEFLCKTMQPALIVVDTMFKVVQTEDINNYGSMIETLKTITDTVRQYGTHILYVHHVNKPARKSKTIDNFISSDASIARIMGSQGIVAEVDNTLFITRNGKERYLTTFPRVGDVIDGEVLFWDEDREVYIVSDTI